MSYLKESKRLVLISCSSDRSIIFREWDRDQTKKKMFSIYHQEVEKSHKFLSMELRLSTLYVGLDKKVNLYSIETGKLKNSWESRDDHQIKSLDNMKLALDCSGTYLAVYNSDKVVRVRDSHNNVVARLRQGDTLTGMLFNKYFITTGYDGCIFVWRLSQDVRTHIERK
jgi:WD40 repeat protein